MTHPAPHITTPARVEGRPRAVQQPCALPARGEGRPRPVRPYGAIPVWVIFAIAFVTAVLWRWWCVPYGDDYIYSHMFETDGLTRQSNNWLGHPIATLGDAWASSCRHYMTGPGRLANSLSFFMALLPRWLVVVIGALAVAAQPLLAALVAGGRKALRRPGVLAALYILMWLLLPWSDHMQSIVFLTNYALSACAILIAMLLFNRLGGGPSRALRATGVISCCLIALLACWMHEGFSVALIAWMVGSLILRPRPRSDSATESPSTYTLKFDWPPAWTKLGRPRLLMLLSALVGFALSLSPGTWGRIGESTGPGIHIPVQDILLLAPVAVLAIVTLRLLTVSKRRLPATWHDDLRALIPYWMGIAGNLAVVIASHASGRALWPAILLSLVALWHLLYQHKSLHTRWLWLPLTAVYTLMMLALIVVQVQVCDLHHRIHPLLSSSPIVYSDSVSISAPWYVFGVPLTDKYTDRINLHFELQAAIIDTPSPQCATISAARSNGVRRASVESERRGAPGPGTSAVILPTACRDLPWNEWPQVPGDNPYRGSLAHMVTTDSVGAPRLRLHMGAPQPSMSPIKRLIAGAYHAAAPSAELTVPATLDRVYVLDGDTLYRVSLPPLPYLWSDRAVTAVDLIR